MLLAQTSIFGLSLLRTIAASCKQYEKQLTFFHLFISGEANPPKKVQGDPLFLGRIMKAFNGS